MSDTVTGFCWERVFVSHASCPRWYHVVWGSSGQGRITTELLYCDEWRPVTRYYNLCHTQRSFLYCSCYRVKRIYKWISTLLLLCLSVVCFLMLTNVKTSFEQNWNLQYSTKILCGLLQQQIITYCFVFISFIVPPISCVIFNNK